MRGAGSVAGSRRRTIAVTAPALAATIPSAASYISTPDHADFSGADLDVRFRFAPAVWPPTASTIVAGQWGTTHRWDLFLQTTGKLSLGINLASTGSASGVTGFKQSTIAIPATAGAMVSMRIVIDADNGASGYDVKFYYGQADIALNAGWTQAGTTVTTAGASALYDATDPIVLSSYAAGGSFTAGDYARMVFMNSIGGTVTADFDATKVTTTSTNTPNTYTDTTGKVWTLTGSDWTWKT